MLILDLGGVLFLEPSCNLAKAAKPEWNVDIGNGKFPALFYQTFNFINHLFQKECMREWFLGRMSGMELYKKIQDHIDKEKYDSFFRDNQERNLIKYGSEMILIPEKIAASIEIFEEGFEFIKQCKKDNVRLLILSNWDPISAVLVKKKFPEVFSLFDNKDIFIPPATMGYIKPDLEIFELILSTTKLDRSATFFIDDNAANIAAAKQCGIKAVHHTTWKTTKQELENLGFGMLIKNIMPNSEQPITTIHAS